MYSIFAALESRQIIAVLLGGAGLLFLIAALIGQGQLRGVRVRLTSWPRLLAGVVGVLLLVPVATIALDARNPRSCIHLH